METKQIRVTGLVQGVGFRWTTQMVANDLGIKGTVKNNMDGSVTIVAQADPLKLAQFISKVKASPTPAGRVDNIEVKNLPDQKPFHSFTVIG
ncbi:acylphosphatase [Lactobacillus hominis]|uniref:acylphosphatase n=1 Tax=Lactobacillus hominis DSM 23910 = CRBIP 24.179 TaxID=1423758 RepID=I7JUW6_9LACO|nr:acylphosphatase [Lactobacillus hominis]KRM85677.1 hypothetical protein FC41_GL000991 [Lactobacillus hominis DSM 23910 = CRBIP 24.179]MCT3347274.1 acylphosphatase [Lactobacillus hominis]CCI81801.1 Putative acylphosphatase [Lactobacillus hominis DSM 23910 = CRBIP 24.179]